MLSNQDILHLIYATPGVWRSVSEQVKPDPGFYPVIKACTSDIYIGEFTGEVFANYDGYKVELWFDYRAAPITKRTVFFQDADPRTTGDYLAVYGEQGPEIIEKPGNPRGCFAVVLILIFGICLFLAGTCHG